MTKSELMEIYNTLLAIKGFRKIDGITRNSNKKTLENAIECLECADSKLDEYAIVVKLKYPNIFRTIASNETDFKNHAFNRLYVFNTAKMILS